jgi:sortase (surface protein transpeptidase)
VTARLSKATITGSTLYPPVDPAVVGRWTGGAPPTGTRGRTVAVGHSVRSGYGAFDALGSLRHDDDVVISTGRASFRYGVESVRILGDAAFARRSAGIFRQTGAPALVLLTCSGWDGAAYRSTIVVLARPSAYFPGRPGN